MGRRPLSLLYSAERQLFPSTDSCMAAYVVECCFKRFMHPKTKHLHKRFEHMHPDVHKGVHNRIRPVLQLGVGIELIKK